MSYPVVERDKHDRMVVSPDLIRQLEEILTSEVLIHVSEVILSLSNNLILRGWFNRTVKPSQRLDAHDKSQVITGKDLGHPV